jgi:hypothetical protein
VIFNFLSREAVPVPVPLEGGDGVTNKAAGDGKGARNKTNKRKVEAPPAPVGKSQGSSSVPPPANPRFSPPSLLSGEPAPAATLDATLNTTLDATLNTTLNTTLDATTARQPPLAPSMATTTGIPVPGPSKPALRRGIWAC